jgi:hypothetical protein
MEVKNGNTRARKRFTYHQVCGVFSPDEEFPRVLLAIVSKKKSLGFLRSDCTMVE